MHYPINEIFQTIQGEGFHSGTPALFVRFQGCPVACSWCDTKHSWTVDPKQQSPLHSILDKQESDQRWAHVGVAEIIDLIFTQSYSARHVVITGGEPCLHDLTPLTTKLGQLGYFCQIETSGTYKVLCNAQTWVTVSPKIGMRGGMELCQQALKRADEIKHPVARERDIENLLLLLQQIQFAKKPIIALQPVSQSKRATEICIEACLLHNWQLSVQLHKYLGIS